MIERRTAVLAARVAEQLGRSVAAPVLACVPEGNIDPPSLHMRYSATVSVPAARGYTQQEIGRHAGPADTALAWAVDASLVRPQASQPVDVVSGDPRRASAELGREGVQHIVAASAAAIRSRTAGAPNKH